MDFAHEHVTKAEISETIDANGVVETALVLTTDIGLKPGLPGYDEAALTELLESVVRYIKARDEIDRAIFLLGGENA